MFFVKFVLLSLTISGVLCAKEDGEIAEETDVRESREYGPETWRAVEEEKVDMSGWIPQDPSAETQELPSKRRRLRKRKRRPPHITMSDESFEEETSIYHPRERTKPLRLDESDVWEDMEHENPKRISNRRRIIPAYNSEESPEYEPEPEIITEKEVHMNPLQAVIRFEEPSEDEPKPKQQERIRDPFEALKVAEEKQKTPQEIKHTAPPNLKALLKRTGGSISLSEILQRKNISLSELLTGNIKAISALTETPESSKSTEAAHVNEATKYQRLPPSERKKITNRIFEQSEESTETISSREVLEAQRKRLALLHSQKDNRVYLGITHNYEIVTEAATEKRIFVPANSKHYSTITYKPILLQNTPKSTVATTHKPTLFNIFDDEKDNNSVSSNTVVPPKIPPFKKLPITSAKLLTRMTTKMPTGKTKVFTIPPKAIKINIEDILKSKKFNETPTKIEDTPLKISLDLTAPLSPEKPQDVGEKLPITAREEILEMLKDPAYEDRLSRILQERNMTIEELVEQRERGSSQLHLADIFHNKTREPEPIEELYIGVIKNDYFDSTREQKSRDFDKETPETIPKDFVETNLLEVTQKHVEAPVTTAKPNVTFNYAAIIPFWKQFHPELFEQYYRNAGNEILKNPQSIEDIENQLSGAMNDRLGAEPRPKNYYLDEESLLDIPTGIKSALLASFAIIGLSIFMFLTILVIFKWTQKNKNKLNYTGSLSGAKIKSPILEMPHKSALKTFVCETLGRRAYKSQLQSMSDVWDHKKQKF